MRFPDERAGAEASSVHSGSCRSCLKPSWFRVWVGVVLMSCLLMSISKLSVAQERREAVFLPILVYHQIRSDASGPPDSLEAISIERFEEQMRFLADQKYLTLSAAEVHQFVLGRGSSDPRQVAIHFDDGWKSALLALPVLERLGLKATFWIIAEKGIGWPHMDWDEVVALSRSPLFDVQSHSMTHPWKDGETLLDWQAGRVPGKGRSDIQREIADSRRQLEERLGLPVQYFAWPRGLYNEALITMAREAGYQALYTVDDGVNRPGDDRLRLKRVMVHGGCDMRTFAAQLRDGVYRSCTAAPK